MYYPTCNSYFSGAGGADQGLTQAGVKIIQSVEYDQAACDTLRLNFSHKVEQKDIRLMTVKDQPDADIMGMTFPCTKYSTIADIHGARTGDDLFLHAFRHIAIKQPEAYWVENVPGMKKFPVVMEAMTKLPGYFMNVFCPVDAKNWLPQSRKRLILIGTKRNFAVRPPEQTRLVTLAEIIEENPEINIPQYVYTRLNGGYRDAPIISDPEKGDIAPTCVAHYSKDRGTRLIADKRFPHGVRPYTVREYARLQGFPDHFQFAGSEAEQYKQIGNAVAVQMGEWIGTELLRYFN